MPIVTSTLETDRTQEDGRRKIAEAHTDHLGVVHYRRYMAEAGDNIQAGLAASAAAIEAQLAAQEIEANLQEIEGGN